MAKLPKFYKSLKHKILNRDVAVNRRTITHSPHTYCSQRFSRKKVPPLTNILIEFEKPYWFSVNPRVIF